MAGEDRSAADAFSSSFVVVPSADQRRRRGLGRGLQGVVLEALCRREAAGDADGLEDGGLRGGRRRGMVVVVERQGRGGEAAGAAAALRVKKRGEGAGARGAGGGSGSGSARLEGAAGECCRCRRSAEGGRGSGKGLLCF